MKLFTIKEANEMIRVVRPILGEIRSIYKSIDLFRKESIAASNSAQLGGGGMKSGSQYVNSLFKLGENTAKLDEIGIQIKDYDRGLIDFPSERDGEIVLLCWQLGEGDEIEWWHEIESGFAGRKRI
ncbi:MAG: DUF2203 domain-containing protein [Acidobacteria bacterium]|nr:DUF2203 domain-containing protein [Acidobacteriota bacterium]